VSRYAESRSSLVLEHTTPDTVDSIVTNHVLWKFQNRAPTVDTHATSFYVQQALLRAAVLQFDVRCQYHLSYFLTMDIIL